MPFPKFPSPSLAASLSSLALLAGCVGPGEPQRPVPTPLPRPAPVRPTPEPAATPPPPAPVEWQYRPAAPGDWSYAIEANGSIARFGLSPASPQLTLRCDRAGRRITLARAGVAQGNALTIRTSYGAQSWPAGIDPAAGLVAARTASDTAWDQIAYSRGKIAVEAAGAAPLIVPAWAEIGRVIEDCR